jgi:hypothetical protein
VWAGTEFDLNVFIDMIGLMAERAGMSALTPGPLGRPRALSGLNAERSSLAVRSALGGFERLLELGDALCIDFQLPVQRRAVGPQGLDFQRHLGQTLSLRQRGLE